VLGAGASRPYGFPTGEELVKEICERFPGSFEAMEPCDGSTPQERKRRAEALVLRLRTSPCRSIDDFLERNQDLLGDGKIAIASCLLPREDERRLLDTKDWYTYLIEWWLKRPVKLAVITFNYERSFEQAFYLALKDVCGEEEARTRIRGARTSHERQLITVAHVHGSFGLLPWCALPHGSGLPYGITQESDVGVRVKQAAEQLRLVFEPPTGRALARCRPYLARASRVLFLGFGYDQRNLERIDPIWSTEKLQPTATIAGTAHGPAGPTGPLEDEAKQLLRRWAGSEWHGELKVVPKKIVEAIQQYGWLP